MADPLEDYLSQRGKVPTGTSSDPLEAYLATKSGVIDSGAKSLSTAPGVPDIHVNRFPQMALDHPVEASTYDPGDLWRAGQAVKHVGGEFVAHPIETIKNPAKRHEFERGVGDVVTLGYGNKLADAAARSLQPQVPKALAGLTNNPEAVTALERDPNWNPDQEAALAPGYRTTGQVVGSLLPNPITKAAGLAAKPISAAIDAIPGSGMLPGAGLGAVKGIATYEATAPAMAALAADSEGDRLGAAVRAAKNPYGLALGGGLGAVGGAAQGFARKIRDPLTQTGRDINAIEAVGGEVRPFGEPARGGEFESPEMQGLQRGRAGRHELAAKSVDRVLAANDEQYRAAQESWGETADNILRDHGDETHFATNTHDILNKLEQDNTVNGVVGDEKLAGAIRKARAMLQAHEPSAPPPEVQKLIDLRDNAKSPMVRDAINAEIEAAGGTKAERPGGKRPAAQPKPAMHYDDITQQWEPYDNPYAPHHLDLGDVAGVPQTDRNTPALKMQFEKTAVGPVPELTPPDAIGGTGVKVDDFIKARKVLNRMARNTQDPSERYAYGKILDAMKQDAGDIDPRIAQLNADYAKQMRSLSQTNDALFGQNKPVVKVTEGAKQSAAARMDRIGEDTKPGMRAEPRMQRFAEARPSNAREAALNRAKQAAERLRYGEPQTSTGFEQSIARGAHRATASTIGAATGGALGHLPGAAAGYAAGKLLENLPQAKVRLGLPVADFVARNVTGSSSVPANRIMELSRARREEDKKRAQVILNGAK